MCLLQQIASQYVVFVFAKPVLISLFFLSLGAEERAWLNR